MRKSILCILILGFMTFACENDKPEPRDKIVYIDFEPDIEISTIRDYYTHQNQYCTEKFPLPKDTLVYFDLDINNDSIIDFQFIVSHSEQYSTVYCGKCRYYTTSLIKIKPMNPNVYINEVYWIQNYDATQIIPSSDSWWTNNTTTALIEGGCMNYGPYLSFRETYWGFKLDDMFGWIHVERLPHNGLRIKELAYNLNKNSSIKAGQKE
jgi:hypothetical protein